MNLEDFHTKVLRLVEEAEYPEGDIWDRVLRDTLISGLASDRIIKEGKNVTLARVMEITRLEVSTQKHIDRMQETAKVNYVSMERASRKESQNLVVAKVQQTVAAVGTVVAAPEPIQV